VRVLDLDLDFFLDGLVFGIVGERERDIEFDVWDDGAVLAFLEERRVWKNSVNS
jgi:hypothetical protein